MSQRVYRTGVVRTSRQYLSRLECPGGHKMYLYNLGDEGITNCFCDLCGERQYNSFYGCRTCDFDICSSCSQTNTQLDINRASSRPRSQPQQVFQACCMVAIAHFPTEQERLTASARGERYNGRRPNYYGRRVSRQDYPDPTQYGWRFTGSCEGGRAEFFEKHFGEQGIVKLDFYYTTGTVKTVLDHPRQGVTQLFAKGDSLSPSMYRQILQNPRHHTGNRYHRRR